MQTSVIAAVGAWALSLAPAIGEGYFDPLTVAAIQGDSGRVEALLAAGAEPNSRNWLGLTPLAAAMRSCRMNVAVLDLLVAAGADIEARSGVGATPLMVAWQRGRDDLAEALLEAGADTEIGNMYGDTAVEYRAYFSGGLPKAAFATLAYTSLGVPVSGQGSGTTRCAID